MGCWLTDGIKRWDVDERGFMVEDDKGTWILYTAHQMTELENFGLKSQINTLKKAVKEMSAVYDVPIPKEAEGILNDGQNR